jgi:hypothetical protein
MRRLLSSDAPPATILVRLLLGSVFLSEGIQKFLYPAELGTGRFAKIGLPHPEIMAPFAGTCEIVCGALVIVGLLTRSAALILLIEFEIGFTRDGARRGKQLLLLCGGGSSSECDSTGCGTYPGAGVYVRLDQSGDRTGRDSLGFDGMAVCPRGSFRRVRAYHVDVVNGCVVFPAKTGERNSNSGPRKTRIHPHTPLGRALARRATKSMSTSMNGDGSEWRTRSSRIGRCFGKKLLADF